ncbi:MAG: acyltransferase family protein [Clostridiales bacterium]|nr:acyltransferase family protein [Clostridiales bacterium]
MAMKHRVPYFDTLRFLSCVLIYATHFIARFDSGLFHYTTTFPFSLLLHGVSGKLGVSMFAVILGWFAGQAGQEGKGTLSYIVSRYLYFFSSGLIINLLYWLAGNLGLMDIEASLIQVLVSSLTIGFEIFNTFWCMRFFFIASVLCFLNTRYHLHPVLVLAEIVILIWMGQIWIAICLFGEVALLLDEQDWAKRWLDCRWVQLALLLIAFILIKRSESVTTYLIDGACSAMVVLAVGHSRTPQNILDWRRLAPITQQYMGVFLIHVLVFRLLGPTLYVLVDTLPHAARFFSVWGICLVVIVLLSFPMTAVVKRLSAALFGLVSRLPIFAKEHIEPTT